MPYAGIIRSAPATDMPIRLKCAVATTSIKSGTVLNRSGKSDLDGGAWTSRMTWLMGKDLRLRSSIERSEPALNDTDETGPTQGTIRSSSPAASSARDAEVAQDIVHEPRPLRVSREG